MEYPTAITIIQFVLTGCTSLYLAIVGTQFGLQLYISWHYNKPSGISKWKFTRKVVPKILLRSLHWWKLY